MSDLQDIVNWRRHIVIHCPQNQENQHANENSDLRNSSRYSGIPGDFLSRFTSTGTANKSAAISEWSEVD